MFDAPDSHALVPRPRIRTAVLDLIGRAETGRAATVEDEAQFLAALHEIIQQGRSPADELRDKYHGDGNGALGRIFARYGY